MRYRLCESCYRDGAKKYANLRAQMDSHTDIKDIGQSAEPQQITTFVDDVSVQEFTKPFPSSVSQWTSMAQDSPQHTIASILARPVPVQSGELNSTDLVDSEVFSLKFPDVLLQQSLNMVKKLDYFTYFRANIKVKFVFNAIPFQAGRFWMAFSPYNDASNRPMRTHYSNYTGYPGAEIDIGSSAPCEIKIPYCAPLSHYNLVDGHSNMGHLILKTLAPIRSGTATTVPYKVFAWFEDVELALPTSQTTFVPSVLEAQIYSESWEKSSRPVSSTLSTIGAISGYVADHVPILATFARPVEWVSKFLSGAASIFGWSKPKSLTDVTPFYNMPAKGFTNMDGIDHSVTLGAAPDNGLTIPKGLFSTEVDEMDISYVVSKSCMFDRFSWNTTDAEYFNMSYFPVHPGVVNQRLGTQPVYPTTLVGFVNTMFKQWRGGLKYRLSIAKTVFHSGRIRITYHPAVTVLGPTTVYENAYNWILDLSESSELEFEIPYISNMPWKRTYVGTADEIRALGEQWSTGLVTIQVLTPLKAASGQVSTTVDCFLWISGAKDMSFAIPTFSDYNCVSTGNPTTVLEEPLEAQIFNATNVGIEHNEQTRNSADKLFQMSSMSATMPEQLTIGEKISSLRQLIKRFGIAGVGNPFPWSSAANENNFAYVGPQPFGSAFDPFMQNVVIDPAYFGNMTTDAPVGVQLAPPDTVASSRTVDGSGASNVSYGDDFIVGRVTSCKTPLQYISTIFRFYTGGKRYKFMMGSNSNFIPNTLCTQDPAPNINNDPTSVGKFTELLTGWTTQPSRTNLPLVALRARDILTNGAIDQPYLFPDPNFPFDLYDKYDSNFKHIMYPDLNGAMELEVPYYGMTPISLVAEGEIPNTEGLCVSRSLLRVTRGYTTDDNIHPVVTYTADANYPQTLECTIDYIGSFTLLEAAADDFTFGYLIGSPSVRRI